MRTDDNNISVLWTNAEPLFYCTYNLLKESHDRTSTLGLTEQDADALHIARIVGDTLSQQEACMGLVLVHEMAHCIGLDDQYFDDDHEQPFDDNNNPKKCVMNAYYARTDAEHRQYYEDVLTGEAGVSAFCRSCKSQLVELLKYRFDWQ